MMNRSLTELRSSLESLIASYGTAVVGYSAGVDSSVVAAAAKSALGSNALAVTAVTETITTDDLLLASQVAEQLEIAHQWLYYNELDIPNYASNPTNRCYFCKDALYARLRHVANENGYNAVLDGSNADDAGDYRPGRQAAAEQGVRSPLLELGITKAEVRQLAEQYGLPNHDKPSAPCLSSRVPYGTPITREILEKIARAESALRRLGFGELRVRHHDHVARIELPPSDFQRALQLSAQIDDAVRAAGYAYVSLDLRGFRSGALNETLTQIQLPSR
ncbi:MAG: ATP-dependent sacrificial sulfur transferase LarE [Chlorobi bacterium]|nr:ATP-dependent sacrificial sulfur transferase LarE [Chlorobiota bacterium]MBX7217760.1 ATP-dependent sacrificial sulfur transferase LarE [Candidatus Kapabacteria bacterium]